MREYTECKEKLRKIKTMIKHYRAWENENNFKNIWDDERGWRQNYKYQGVILSDSLERKWPMVEQDQEIIWARNNGEAIQQDVITTEESGNSVQKIRIEKTSLTKRDSQRLANWGHIPNS